MSVVGNRLDIRNPFVTHGIFQIAWGGLLLVLLVWFGFSESDRLREIFDALLERRDVTPLNLAGSVGFAIVLVAGLGSAAANLFGGLKNTLSFIVPVNVPANLSDPSSISRLLFDRVIGHFENPSSLLIKASRFVSDRFLYMVRPQARFVERAIKVGRNSLLLLLLCLLPYFLQDVTVRASGVEFSYEAPIVAAFLLLLILAGYGVGVLLLTAVRPEASVVEERMHLSRTGNPNNFFGFLERKLDELRVGSFQNRVYAATLPIKGKVELNESNSFTGNLVLETQPVPMERGAWQAALSMDVFGLLLRVLAVFFFLRLLLSALSPDPALNWADAASLVAVLFAARCGAELMEAAFSLFNTFMFQSDLLEITMSGNYDAASIGMGDGRGGTLHSQRISVQSDANLLVRAGRIISYSEGMEGPRWIVSSVHDEGFRRGLQEFINSFLSFRDTSGKLAGVDVQDEDLNAMLNVNARIAGQQSAAQSMGRRLAYEGDAPRRLPEFGEEGGAVGAPAGAIGGGGVQLFFLSGEFGGETIPLDGTPLVLGRDPGRCTLILTSKSISKVHCSIEKNGSGWVVVDVGSTYGTYVDGARIPPNQRYRLQMGSVVSLAKALEFKIVPAGSDTAY
ncbi:MAG: FHA domain-containing protein [Pseudodesulfovibrio sp.]|jgi:hypothetical protein|uniref:FHA domain-containing protein n=1 Tax=Pseudodesulfovibrio sp. TaxID=2035812 RepID=UPI003D126D51